MARSKSKHVRVRNRRKIQHRKYLKRKKAASKQANGKR